MADAGIHSVATEHEPSIKGFALTNMFLGLLIVAAAFLTAEALVFWNTLVVGVLVAVIGAANAWSANRHHAGRVRAPAALNILLGAWLAVSVLVLPVDNIGLFWANITFGILVVLFAGYITWASVHDRRDTANA